MFLKKFKCIIFLIQQAHVTVDFKASVKTTPHLTLYL